MIRIDKKISTSIAACALCVIAFLANNGIILPDIMESRNIVTAREMVYDGNWIIPTMNGELRLEKPPLPTWIAAVAEIISPDNIAAQRTAAALAALLLVLYFWKFAKKVLKLDPVVPTLLLCTCYNLILMGRTASWDIFTHAFMMGGIYHLSIALAAGMSKPSTRHKCPWGQFIAAGVYIGLSLMSKGPVSLYALFLPFIISAVLFLRPKARGKGLGIAVLALLAIVIGSWWYIYVHHACADALTTVVQKESGSWMSHNIRPWWYYWKFFLETGVWSLLLLTAIFLPMFNLHRRSNWQWLFAMAWMLFSLVLLSLLPEKKPRYLLPLLIPAAYVMACLIEWWRTSLNAPNANKSDKICFRVNSWLIAIVILALPIVAWAMLYKPGHITAIPLIAIAVVSVAIAAYIAVGTVKLKPMRMLWGVSLLFAASELFFLPCLNSLINNPDIHSISLTRDIKELDGIPFYHDCDSTLRIELVYAANRKILPLNIHSADSVAAKLPCAILTKTGAGQTLPQEVTAIADTTYIGLFDDNHRPRGNRRYSSSFVYHITLLTPKETGQKP